MKALDTFKVDNWLIQNAPSTFGSRRMQMYLPSLEHLEPFGPFDYWATMAIYSLLDPEDPTAAIQTTPTKLLEVLEFARVVNDGFEGYESYKQKHYGMLEESLQRLFTVEIYWRDYFTVKKTDPKTGKRRPGRPKKQWVEYHGRVLQSYKYIYPPGIEPPEYVSNDRRINVNRAKTAKGDKGPAIWKLKNGPRPVGIELRLSTDLVKGITQNDPNIGATIFPIRIFELRKTIGQYPKAVHLMVWICRQVKRTMSRRLDWLAEEYLNMKGRNRSRNRDTLVSYFAMLQQEGIIESYEFYDKDGDPWVKWTKSEDWHFTKEGTPVLTASAEE